MGLLRLILALAVVVDHAPQSYGVRMVPGDVAVEMFFMISGFYMALVLSTRYDPSKRSGIGAFYTARYLRLWPAYAITAAALYGWLALIPIVTGHPAVGAFETSPQSLLWKALISFSNLTMFGQDVLTLFHVTPQGVVVLTFGPPVKLDDGLQSLGNARIVSQAWSIGAEIWFYLLAPFLIRLKSLSLFALLAASLALRFVLDAYFGLTIYFFFPAQLALFLAGMLAYRWREKMWVEHRAFAFAGLGLLLGILILFQFLLPQPEIYKWGVYLLLLICMPSIFENFKSNLFDRLIGELSYPIYITHHGIFVIFDALYLKLTGVLPPGILPLSLVIGASLIIYLAVEVPVDRFRHRLVRNNLRLNVQIVESAAPLLGVPLADTPKNS
ncbi:MAG: acyltransferase [Xanthobacteraceae bacterium]